MAKEFNGLDPVSERVLRGSHPKLAGQPDYGLALEPQDEARLRARAEEYGINFDEMKYRFEIAHQVVEAESNHQKSLSLLDQRIVPRNALKNYFEGHLEMAINTKRAASS